MDLHWTKEEDTTLMRLWADGVHTKIIARKLKVGVPRVTRRVKRLKLNRRCGLQLDSEIETKVTTALRLRVRRRAAEIGVSVSTYIRNVLERDLEHAAIGEGNSRNGVLGAVRRGDEGSNANELLQVREAL